MNTFPDMAFGRYDRAFGRALSLDTLREQAPAVFAASADERRSPRYTFIPTAKILEGLMLAGFVPVEARQTQTRSANPLFARHVVRLRRRFETVQLRQAVPEVIFLNSHDGSSNYQFRVGIYRAVCTNGLMVSHGGLPTMAVAHRGNIVGDVVAHALGLSERFEVVAAQVERMELRRLGKDEQIKFAERALTLRYPDPARAGMAPSMLLNCRRTEDLGDDLFSVLNKVQENLLRGGLSRRSASGRLVRMRRITSIRE